MTAGEASLTREVGTLLNDAAQLLGDGPARAGLVRLAGRLGDPVRVAILGEVKAGKSTLVNALVGERVAATDSAECTKVVTWYEHGRTARALAHPVVGEPRQLPMRQQHGRTRLDLDGLDPADLLRVTVEIPSRRLEQLTLVDTPGVASLSRDVSRRTEDFVTGARGNDPPDAVVFLVRRLHDTDVRFMESFHDVHFSGATPVNAIGVLSRADEVSPGRADSLNVAARVAASYSRDARLRTLVQSVVPVSGLLAETAATLREDDYRAIVAVADWTRDDATAHLLSVDRFLAVVPGCPLSVEARRHLLERLGLSGLRLSLVLVGSRTVGSAGELADDLLRRSGVQALRTALVSQFAERSDVLKCQSALRAVEAVASGLPHDAAERLRLRMERIVAGAHGFAELRLLNAIRAGEVAMDGPDLEAAEALLGAAGSSVTTRLDLPDGAAEEEIRDSLSAALARWSTVVEDPFAEASERRAARVLRRSCEGLLDR